MSTLPTFSCLLKQIQEQEKTAREFGFYWEYLEQLIDQIKSECLEIQEAWQAHDQPHLQEEIGDLLQATISLSIFCQCDTHEAIKNSITKFQTRYDFLVQLAQLDGHTTLKHQPTEVLMSYWKRAKKLADS